MKKLVSIVAVLGLSACMGGGSDDIEVSLSDGFGTLLNETRTASGSISVDTRLTSAAQVHATDMFTRDYDSVEVKDVMIADPNQGGALRPKDMGDLANEAGYDWQDLGQLIAKGEVSTADAVARWENETCLSLSSTCYNDPFQNFGIAKAGSGADQRWVMILATPKP
jgi:uncharacterized protein YkwD